MQPLKIKLDVPIQSVSLTNGRPAANPASGQTEALGQQIKKAASLCSALQSAMAQVEQLSRDVFVSHREQIVRLSIEIAAKILAKDIHQRSYEIEQIVLHALAQIPAAQRFTIRLHPEDLAVWQQAAAKDTLPSLENILCIGDPSIGRAECIVETDQGVVEYLIEEQLKQVATALMGAEAPVETAP